MMTAVAQEGKTIRMLVGTQSFDMNTNYVGVLLEEITGYKVQYDYYADDNQLALEIASGTEYDLISVSPNMYQTLLAQGALKNLSAAIEASLRQGRHPRWAGRTPPRTTASMACPTWTTLSMRAASATVPTHFAEHGYQEPATVQEFYDLLVAINDTGLSRSPAGTLEPVLPGLGLSYDLWWTRKPTDRFLAARSGKEYLA